MLELIFAFGVGAAASSWIHFKARKRSQAATGGRAKPALDTAGSLSGAARAAVIIMSCAPDVSAAIYDHLGSAQTQRVTSEITRLPTITPFVRQQVLDDFSRSVGVAPERLEEAARAEPALIARALTVLAGLSATAR